MFLLILGASLAVSYLVITENAQRHDEHQQITWWLQYADCRMELDIWAHSLKQGERVYFTDIPKHLRRCVPRFALEEKVKQQPKEEE